MTPPVRYVEMQFLGKSFQVVVVGPIRHTPRPCHVRVHLTTRLSYDTIDANDILPSRRWPQVALECLSVLKESVSWLSRTLAKKDVPAASAGSAVQVLPAGRRVNGPAAAQGRDQGTSFHALSAAAVISNKSCSSTHRTTSISATTAAATTTATATETPAATMVSPPPQLQGPGHDFHAARACVASMLPSVIDCCSRESLRGSAEDVLAECAAASEV